MEQTNESYKALKNKKQLENKQIGDGLLVKDPASANLILIEDLPVNRKLQYNSNLGSS